MCVVCGPGGNRLFHSIAASFGSPGVLGRPRFVAEEVAPDFTPPLDPTDLEGLKGPADVILRGGHILTMQGGEASAAEAIAIREGRIQIVGSEERVLAGRGRLTRVIDLDGRALLPGFVVADWHTPLSLLCDWFEADETPAAALAAAIADPSNEWLVLRVRGSAGDRGLLAAASRPAVSIDGTGTILAANAAAVSLAPEFAAAEPKEGPAHVSMLLAAFLRRSIPSRDPLRDRLRALLAEASRNGVTMLRFCGLGALAGDDDLSLLKSAAGDAPPLRIRGSVDAKLVQERESAALMAGAGDDMFRIDTATRWIDGASGEPAELAASIRTVRERGWHVTLHADSAQAIELALGAFSAAAAAGTPLAAADGLEHRAPLPAEARAQMRALGLSSGLTIEEEQAAPSPPDSFRTTHATVSVSLDRMVGGPAPLRTLAAAGRPPGLAPRTADLFISTTRAAATRCNAGAITGTLEVGKYADFVFLDTDPRLVAAADLGRLRCVGTWISGREVPA